jgi:muramoyltetrapeptide carboxypeptidase
MRSDPKPVVGFSDISYLHLAVWYHCATPGIHGCLAGSTATETVRRLLMSVEPVVIQRDPTAVSAAVHVPGLASGRVVGGNVTAVGTSIGVRLPDLSDTIVFLEDTKTKGLGLIDRQLTQLAGSGALAGVAGIALGSFNGFAGVEDRGWTIRDVLQDRLGHLGLPVVGGFFRWP